MNKKKILIVLTVAILALTSACSANKNSGSYDDSVMETTAYAPVVEAPMDMKISADYYEEQVMTEEMDEEPAPEGSATGGNPESGGDSGVVIQDSARERKLVETIVLDLQTKEFDKAIKIIEEAVAKSEGYMEYSNVMNSDMTMIQPRYSTARSAHYSIKIPTNDSSSFVEQMQANFHTLSTSKSTQDITASYYDTQTQLDTLVDHEKRLIALLDKGGDLEYIIEIERELASVRYQINSINSQIKNMDSLVNYDTISINLYEVIDYEDVDKLEDTFVVRIQRAFGNSWSNFVSGAEDFAISAVYNLPGIILLIIILVIIIILIRRINKKNKAKTAAKSSEDQDTTADKNSK